MSGVWLNRNLTKLRGFAATTSQCQSDRVSCKVLLGGTGQLRTLGAVGLQGHPLQLWSFVWGFPRIEASSSYICKFLLCTRYSNKNTAKWHQFANSSLHPTGHMIIGKTPEPAAETQALGGQFGVSHLASLGLCFRIWHTVGKGIPPTLTASLGDGLQLSHPRALSWPCQPLSQCPLPQGLVEQCPSQGSGFLGVLEVGGIAAWDSLERPVGSNHTPSLLFSES